MVKNQPLFRLVGTVHPVGILKLLNIQLEDDHGIDIADAVVPGERQNGKGFLRLPLEQQQFNTGSTSWEMLRFSASCRSGTILSLSIFFLLVGSSSVVLVIIARFVHPVTSFLCKIEKDRNQYEFRSCTADKSMV